MHLPLSRQHVRRRVGSRAPCVLDTLERRALLAAGTLDPSFGTGGVVQTSLSDTGPLQEVLVQKDGRILFFTNGGYVARRNADGSPDTTFSPDGTDRVLTTAGLAAAALRDDGKILMAFGGENFYVGRYLPDATPDPTWNHFVPTDFVGAFDTAQAVLPLPGGKVLAAGKAATEHTQFTHAEGFGLARYNPDGSPDTAFGTGGKASLQLGWLADVAALAVQVDGKIVVAGNVYSAVGLTTPDRAAVVRFNANGTVDTTFGSSGKVLLDFGGPAHFSSALIQGDGKILAGGVTGAGDLSIVRLLSSGAPDPSFDGDGKLVLPRAPAPRNESAMALESDGKILWAGTAGGAVSVYRFNPDGTPDAAYGTGGVARTDATPSNDNVRTLTLHPDGRALVGAMQEAGGFTDGGYVELLRYTADPGAPVAEAGGPYSVPEGGKIRLNSASGDPDGDITLTEWDFDYDGATFNVDATGPSPEFSAVGLDGTATRTVAVRVTDGTGNVRIDTASLTITNVAPTVRYSGTGAVAEGSTYVLNLSAGNDPGPDTISHWDVNWGDGTVQRLDGNPATASHVYGNGPATFSVIATATDEDGSYRALHDALDTTFGGGIVRTGFDSPARDNARAMALAPDGKIVAAGESELGNLSLMRFTADGRLDPTFGAGGKIWLPSPLGGFTPAAVAVQDDGKVLVAGADFVNPAAPDARGIDFTVRRYNVDGSPDLSFGTGGAAFVDFNHAADEATALLPLPGGKLLVGGTTRDPANAAGPAAVVRLNADGSLDTTFGDGGYKQLGIWGSVSGAARDAAGNLFLVTRPWNFGRGLTVDKLTPGGQLDASFAGDGELYIDGPGGVGVALVGDKVLVADTDFSLLRFNADGSVDTAFGTGGRAHFDPTATTDVSQSLALAPDGRIVIGGYSSGGGPNYGLSVRALPDGSPDPTYTAARPGVRWDLFFNSDRRYDAVVSVGVQGDGKVVIFGTTATNAGVYDFAASRYNLDNTLDTTFGGAAGTLAGRAVVDFAAPGYDRAKDVVVQADGKTLVLGDSYLATGRAVLARYNVDGSLDPTFGAGGRVSLGPLGAQELWLGSPRGLAVLDDGKILVGGVASRTAVVRLNPDGSLDATFGQGGVALLPTAQQVAPVDLLVQADGRILVVTGLGLVMRLNADGSPDTSYATASSTGQGFTLFDGALQADGKLVVTGVNSFYQPVLERFTADGALDPGFDQDGILTGADGDPYATSVLVLPTGKIVVGPRNDGFGNALVRYNSNGTTDTTFGGGSRNPGWADVAALVVRDLAAGPNGKIYALGSTQSGNGLMVVALNANGSRDTSVGPDGVVSYTVPGIPPGFVGLVETGTVGRDGRAVVAGQDGNDFLVARLHLTAPDKLAVNVLDMPPVLAISGPPTGEAGQPYTVNLSVTDPGVEPRTWHIDWGDGSIETLPGDQTSAAHTYAEGRNRYTITATLDDGRATFSAAPVGVVIAGVNDAPVINDADLHRSAAEVDEGTDFVLTGTFTDPDTADGHTVTVAWGDDFPDTVLTLPPGELSFTARRSYADDNPTGTPRDAMAIRVTVSDGAASDSAAASVTVRNVSPVARIVSTPQGVKEGSAVSLTSQVTDPAKGVPTETLAYTWHVQADNGQVVADGHDAAFTFTPDDNGAYTVTLTVTDDDGGIGTATTSFTAADVPPTVVLSAAPAREGSPVTLSLSATDPGRDTISAWRIDWGDGAIETLSGGATSAAHTYADGPATYRVGVIVTDEDGTHPGTYEAGALDPTFGAAGIVASTRSLFEDLLLQSDGKIVAIDGGIPDYRVPWKVSRFNADGTPDLSFGNRGVVTLPVTPETNSEAGAIQADGKIVVVGWQTLFESFVTKQKAFIARYNPDGTPDATFGTNGSALFNFSNGQTTRFFDVAVLGDGRIVVSGTGRETGGGTPDRAFAARFNPDGSPDPTFGTGGRTAAVVYGAVGNQTPALLVQRDGRIVLGFEGQFSTPPGTPAQSQFMLARFTADGQTDATFGQSGIVRTRAPAVGTNQPPMARARDLAEMPDGRIVAGGYASTTQGVASVMVARYKPDGSPDTSFGGDGVYRTTTSTYNSANAIALAADGGVFVAGGTDQGFLLMRLRPDGTPDPLFGAGGSVVTAMPFVVQRGPGAQAVALLPNGRILLAGFGGMARYEPGRLPIAVANVAPVARFAAGGTVDPNQPATVSFLDPSDPSAPDTAAGFRYSYDFNNDGDFADPGEAEGVADASRQVTFAAPGLHTVRGRIADKDGGFTDYLAQVVVRGAVVGRGVFYNHSAYDGNDATANAADDGALATDKQALLAGGAGTAFVNVTSYSRGLNGVVIDVAGLPLDATLTPGDFVFRSGRGPDPATFTDGPAPLTVQVRRGAGAFGSDRVTLVWRDYDPSTPSPLGQAVANGWLEVTVKANANTGLSAPDVFCFGNLIGETGNAATLSVNAIDLGAVRANQLTGSPVTGRFDFNRDGRINAVDLGLCRAAQLRSLPLLATTAAPLALGEAPRPRRIAADVLG